MTTINEQAILDLFNDMPISEVFEVILENFSDHEAGHICNTLLLPTVVKLFAEKYSNIDDEDGEGLNRFWEAFLTFNKIPEDLGNVLAHFINEASKQFNDDEYKPDEYTDANDSDDDDDSEVGVIAQDEWDSLSSSERIAKVKKFLAAVSRSGDDPFAPFVKPGIGDLPDPYKNVWGSKVKAFDRSKSSFGHTDNSKTPWGSNSYLQKNASNDQIEESVSREHFREVANTIRAIEDPKKHQEFADHHAALFAKQNPRFDHARFHAAAGTVFGGKRKLREGSLPSLPIQEGLFDAAAHKRVQAYARFMDNEPTYTKNVSVHGGMAEDLREAGKLRDEHEAKFGLGLDPAEWDSSITREKGKRR
jgi:hypothetical protein